MSVGGTATTQTIAVGWIDFSAAGFPGQCAACTSTGAGLLSATVGPTALPGFGPGRITQHYSPAVGPAGEVYVTWMDSDAANFAGSGAIFAVSDLNGVTGGLVFTAPVIAGFHDLGFRTFTNAQPNRGYGTIPMGVVVNTGPNQGRLVITYADEFPAVAAGGASGAPIANQTTVCTNFSDNFGVSWNGEQTLRPYVLNEHAWLPWLAVDRANGNLYLGYKSTHRLASTNSSDRLVCVSTNGGASFGADIRVSQGVATPFGAFGGAAGDYLEYEGIAVHDHRCFSCWADNANFTTTGNVANPHGTTTSDLYVSVFQHKP
jgi:hypothetical protein